MGDTAAPVDRLGVRVLDLVSLALWILFWLYWFASAVGSGQRSPSNLSRGVVLRVVAFRPPDPVRSQGHTENSFGAIVSPIAEGVGFSLFVLGFTPLAVLARLFLGRNWGTPMSEKIDATLVTTGPYRYIRHPIYSGIILAMVGTALRRHHLLASRCCGAGDLLRVQRQRGGADHGPSSALPCDVSSVQEVHSHADPFYSVVPHQLAASAVLARPVESCNSKYYYLMACSPRQAT